MSNSTDAAFAARAAAFVADRNIGKNGAGYITAPISDQVAEAISANYFIAFVSNVNTKEFFIVSKDYKGSTLSVHKKDMGAAIGNIKKVASNLHRKMQFVAKKSQGELKAISEKKQRSQKKQRNACDFLKEVHRVRGR